MPRILLSPLLVLAFAAPTISPACTVFKITHNGRTLIGNNEDAWSINSQIRFEQGRNGGYGAIYFDHFNGHPFRKMGPQLGMNEAGLVFDGLTIQPHHATPVPGRKQVHFDDLMPQLMRTCATVHEAATVLRAYDFSWLTRSMLFFADRNGDYLIVENDTMMLGNDPTYAVGNWRMGSCTDPDAIPIPRLQAGRALLNEGTEASLEHGTAVLQVMQACRSKMGEGTIFSTLFDPGAGKAYLYFYHDFQHMVPFDLKTELAQGDRTLVMADLFPANAEFERLKAYSTPFHQRWLFWTLVVFAGALALWLFVGSIMLLVRLIALMRKERDPPILPLFLSLLFCLASLPLIGVILTQEGVFYFGLGDVHPFLAWLPVTLIALALSLAWMKRNIARPLLVIGATALLPFFTLLGYWGMIVP